MCTASNFVNVNTRGKEMIKEYAWQMEVSNQKNKLCSRLSNSFLLSE